jgi:hypothetical protein
MILELRDDDEVIQNYADTSHQKQCIIWILYQKESQE